MGSDIVGSVSARPPTSGLGTLFFGVWFLFGGLGAFLHLAASGAAAFDDVAVLLIIGIFSTWVGFLFVRDWWRGAQHSRT